MTRAEAVRATVVSVALGVAVAALSQWPVRHADGGSFVRLSWRTEPLRVEECRRLTEEELAAVPAHMRRAEECSGDYVDYELVFVVDGGPPVVDTISPSGLRRDRPVYVLHDEAMEPGAHRVEVVFSALVPADFQKGDRPVTLTWSGDVTLAPRQIALVTLDPTGTELILR